MDISDYMKNKERIFISTLLIISAIIWVVILSQIVSAAQPSNVVSDDQIDNEIEEVNETSYEHLSFKDEIEAPIVKIVKVDKAVIAESKVKDDESFSMKITHYSPYCKGCIGLTKHLEHDVRNTKYYKGMRIIAVDPRVIPLGSIVEMELPGGSIKAVALDIGGAIKGSRIDLLVSSEREALNLGVYKNVKVKIIGGI